MPADHRVLSTVRPKYCDNRVRTVARAGVRRLTSALDDQECERSDPALLRVSADSRTRLANSSWPPTHAP